MMVTANQIVAICAGFATICVAVGWIAKIVAAAKSPEVRQDQRLASIEDRLAKHDELLAKDKQRLDAIEDGTRVTQRAILALLSHGIDGNEVEAMRRAKEELQEFLISR